MADVGCAGVLVADLFCGPMQELPREGQLMAIDDILPGAGGCAANVAIGLARQGFEVDVVGCVGTDPAAKSLLSGLEEELVGCGRVAYTDRYPTSKTVILVVEGQDRRYIHTFGANKAFTVGHIDRDWLAELKVFYLGGLLALPGIELDELLELLRFCRQQKVVTVVDVVVPQDFTGVEAVKRLLPQVDYFLPNDDEAERITGLADPFDQLRDLDACGANSAVITRGESGVVVGRGERFWQAGAYHMQSVDPSGSGDAFASGIIAGILGAWEMPQTLRYASALGASATRAVGTTGGLFSVEEVESFVATHPMDVVCGSLNR